MTPRDVLSVRCGYVLMLMSVSFLARSIASDWSWFLTWTRRSPDRRVVIFNTGVDVISSMPFWIVKGESFVR